MTKLQNIRLYPYISHSISIDWHNCVSSPCVGKYMEANQTKLFPCKCSLRGGKWWVSVYTRASWGGRGCSHGTASRRRWSWSGCWGPRPSSFCQEDIAEFLFHQNFSVCSKWTDTKSSPSSSSRTEPTDNYILHPNSGIETKLSVKWII